jgi:hypothetical protein
MYIFFIVYGLIAIAFYDVITLNDVITINGITTSLQHATYVITITIRDVPTITCPIIVITTNGNNYTI